MDVNKFYGVYISYPPAIVQAAITGTPLTELAGAVLSQDTRVMSPFVSATWNITDAFRVTAGIRYTSQDKSYVRDAATPGSGLYLTNADGSLGPFLGGAILNATGAGVGQTSGDIDSTSTAPEVMAEWDINDNMILFARYTESVKAGGIGTAGSIDTAELIYDDEQAESLEAGLKSRYLDVGEELNITLFSTDYSDLQGKSSELSAGGVVTIIGNAGSATSEGLDVDGRIAVTDFLTLGGNIAWLNAEYSSYPSGPCNRSGSTPAGTIAATCDLKGQALPFAADSSGSVFIDVDKPITDRIRLLANLTVSFSDDYFIEGRNEPTLQQGAWPKLSGRIGIASVDDRWSITVIGQNLTEEKMWLGAQPLFGYDMVYPTMPRTYTVQAMVRF